MTSENFCYWLQGYIELSNCKSLTPEQVQMISDHLQLVFKKETKIEGYQIVPTLPIPQMTFELPPVTCNYDIQPTC
jgi:hypothetical protein